MHNYNYLILFIITQFNIKQVGIQGFPLCVAAILSVSRVSIHLRYWNLLAFGLFCIVTVSCTPRWLLRSYRSL